MHVLMTGYLSLGLVACGSAPKKFDVAAPLPPQNLSDQNIGTIAALQPAAGGVGGQALAMKTKKDCHFSSFHRKNAIGYEFDDRRHLSFTASPSMDLDGSDFEMKVGLRFTKALGGPAKKRPDCTYGSGYYGWLPYAANNDFDIDIDLNNMFSDENIRAYIEKKLEAKKARADDNKPYGL